MQKSLAKLIISISPRRITAAFVLSPKPRPSQKPAPTATMFCKTIARSDPFLLEPRALPHPRAARVIPRAGCCLPLPV